MQFIQPKDIEEAVRYRTKTGYPILAGGTDLIVQWRSGVKEPEGVICISNLKELSVIAHGVPLKTRKLPVRPELVEGRNVVNQHVTSSWFDRLTMNGEFLEAPNEYIEIGALATHSEIYTNKIVQKYFPALADACKTVGASPTQNRGTIGGNVMNASPAGDTLPALLAYEAKLEIVGSSGLRVVGFADFYTGYRKTVLKEDEILTKIILPRTNPKEIAMFYKVGTRKAQAISKVCACFRAVLSDDVVPTFRSGRFNSPDLKVGTIFTIFLIAFGSVAATPVRCYKTEEFLSGKKINDKLIKEATELVQKEISPISDIRSSDVYRKQIAGTLLRRFLTAKCRPAC